MAVGCRLRQTAKAIPFNLIKLLLCLICSEKVISARQHTTFASFTFISDFVRVLADS